MEFIASQQSSPEHIPLWLKALDLSDLSSMRTSRYVPSHDLLQQTFEYFGVAAHDQGFGAVYSGINLRQISRSGHILFSILSCKDNRAWTIFHPRIDRRRFLGRFRGYGECCIDLHEKMAQKGDKQHQAEMHHLKHQQRQKAQREGITIPGFIPCNRCLDAYGEDLNGIIQSRSLKDEQSSWHAQKQHEEILMAIMAYLDGRITPWTSGDPSKIIV